MACKYCRLKVDHSSSEHEKIFNQKTNEIHEIFKFKHTGKFCQEDAIVKRITEWMK